MSLSESISQALNGKRSGKGFRVRSICHGGEDKNLYLADSPEGRLIATCFSHGCTYKKIMLTLEDHGLKPKSEFGSQQKKSFIQKKTRRQLRNTLQVEMHIALQYLNDRNGDVSKLSDSNYLKLHPEFAPMPEELFEREKQAYWKITKAIRELL